MTFMQTITNINTYCVIVQSLVCSLPVVVCADAQAYLRKYKSVYFESFHDTTVSVRTFGAMCALCHGC